MDFDNFIAAAWTDHADNSQAVATRLAAALDRIESPANVAPFVALVTHVYGEHLGSWDDGLAVLDAVRSLPSVNGDQAAAGAVGRGIALLRYAGDKGALPDTIGRNDRIAVLANAAGALAGRHEFRRAIAAYAEALELAASGELPAAPAPRALAVGGNNLASALETRSAPDAEETAGMIMAARGALQYWKIAGTWLEEERAHYRLARSLLQAGDAGGALGGARRCVEVCSAHDAPAFEFFYAHAALAFAQRAGGHADAYAAARGDALRFHAQLAPDDAQWCIAELRELDAAADPA
ncbi:MAG: hypothetical protein ABI790_11650 [Betaproteobacteria bacterium]